MFIKNRQQGFTLFEVLVAMLIAGIALLGLALLEVQIMKSSSSSFNYTLSSIRANSFIDRMWGDLCKVQKSHGHYQQLRNSWRQEMLNNGLNVTDDAPSSALSTLSVNVKLSWDDARFVSDDDANNQLVLFAEFPPAPTDKTSGAIVCP